MSKFVGFECILVGDFNFECILSSAGFTEFSKFMNEYHLVCCDNLDSSKCGFTYYHEGLDQRSLIDHAFVSCALRSRIQEYRIISDGANLSDHLPVTLKLCLTIVRHPVSNPHRRTVKQLHWDKGAQFFISTVDASKAFDNTPIRRVSLLRVLFINLLRELKEHLKLNNTPSVYSFTLKGHLIILPPQRSGKLWRKEKLFDLSEWIVAMIGQQTIYASQGVTKLVVKTIRGLPQGGVISPTMWTLVVDSLLKWLSKQGIYNLYFADDGTVLITLVYK